MKIFICEKIVRIVKNRKRLEKDLGIKLMNSGKEIHIDGEPENEFLAEKAIGALGMGFPYSVALSIKNEDFDFIILHIKDYTSRKDMERIRARIIGRGGKTLKVLNHLTNCNFEILGNVVGIIGPPELIENAQRAIVTIIQGSKQSNVYSFLEKHRYEEPVDLGLKKIKKKKGKIN